MDPVPISAFHAIDNVVLTAYTDDAPLLKLVETIKLLDVHNTTNYYLSVYPGKASYDGTGGGGASGTIGDGTVVDYAFYNTVGATQSGGVWTLNKYASGSAGIIGDATAMINAGSQAADVAVWTSIDPGVGFSSVPDYETAYGAHGEGFRSDKHS